MNDLPLGGLTTVRTSPTIATLVKALAEAQSEMKNPPKDSRNPHFNSKYADLATVRDAVVPILNKHGLAVIQLPTEIANEPALTSILAHSGGEFVETTMQLRPSKRDPQGVGSALTYARRYSLQSMAGVSAEDDDDANAASGGRGSPPAANQRPAGQASQKPTGQTAQKPAGQPPPPATNPKPNKAGPTADTVFDLLEQWCKLSGANFNTELNRLFHWLNDDRANSLEDLDPRQLSDAARAITKKIAEFKAPPANQPQG